MAQYNPLHSWQSWQDYELKRYFLAIYELDRKLYFAHFEEAIHSDLGLWNENCEYTRRDRALIAPILKEIWEELKPNLCQIYQHRVTKSLFAVWEHLGNKSFKLSSKQHIRIDGKVLYEQFRRLQPHREEAQEMVKYLLNDYASEYYTDTPILI
jgi:hypothetical protein